MSRQMMGVAMTLCAAIARHAGPSRLRMGPWKACMATVAMGLLAAGGASVAAATHASALAATSVDCSTANLQTAIDSASPGDTLRVSGTCDGAFVVSTNLTIIGPATLDGQENGTVLSVAEGATVVVDGLTIQNGCECSANIAGGGGVLNEGTLTLENSVVQGSTGLGGGGIFNAVGTLTLENSTVQNNTAGFTFIGDGGGGIFNNATLTLENSTVQDNNAVGNGGGILNDVGATLTVDNSSVRGNVADNGGGIDDSGTLTLENSSIKDNTSLLGEAGGIFIEPAATAPTFENSSVKGNIPSDFF